MSKGLNYIKMRSWALENMVNRELVRTPRDNPDEGRRINVMAAAECQSLDTKVAGSSISSSLVRPWKSPEAWELMEDPFRLVNELNRTILVDLRQNVETMVDYDFGDIYIFRSMLTRFRTQVLGPAVECSRDSGRYRNDCWLLRRSSTNERAKVMVLDMGRKLCG
jgi:hypothetical protein